MKNLIYLFLLVFILSCSKDNSLTENSEGPDFNQIQSEYGDKFNKEASRILSIFKSEDQRVSSVYQANFGKSFSTNDPLSTITGGETASDVKITLDADEFTPDVDSKKWVHFNYDFSKYYGKTVDIKIEDSEKSEEYEVYFPKPVLVNRLGTGNSLYLSRTGNTLTWTADENNASNLILLYVQTYSDEAEENLILNKLIPTEDDGSYSIDHLIKDQTKAIEISFYLGNAVEFTTREGKNLNFCLYSFDAHTYYFE
jgi:hypothetical protein